MSRDDHHEAAAATATIESARAFMRGEYRDPHPGTLAHEIAGFTERARAAMELRAVRAFLVAAAVFAAGMVLAAMVSERAHAQTIRAKPADVAGQSQTVFRSADSGLYTGAGWSCVITQGDVDTPLGAQPNLTVMCDSPSGARAVQVWSDQCIEIGTGQAWGLSALGSYNPSETLRLDAWLGDDMLRTTINGQSVILSRIAIIYPARPNDCGAGG